MSDSTISQLPPALSLSAADLIPVDQGGVTKRATLGMLGNGIVFSPPGVTLTVNASMTFNGTNGTVITFPSTSATLARTDAPQTFVGLQTFGAIDVTTINGLTLTPSTGTLTIAAGKVVTFNNTVTFTGTDSVTITTPATSATMARTDAAQSFTGLQTFNDGITTPSQITSTIATGTAPFVVASTTPVANLSIGGNSATSTAFATPRTIDGVSFDGTANILVVASATHAAPSKATPVDADEFTIYDSVTALLANVTWANIKTTLGSTFAALAGSASQAFSVLPATVGTNAPAASQLVGRNVIVNGGCEVSQVWGTTLITPLTNTWPIDNIKINTSTAGVFQTQQIKTITSASPLADMASLGATAAFTTSVLATHGAPAAGDVFYNRFAIEGFNFARFAYGTANAKVGSLQFKARASVAGTYSGVIANAAATRFYAFTFALLANTDTLVTVPNIAGDTGGTWVGATNAAAAYVYFDLGSGATYTTATVGSWTVGSNILGVTSALKLCAQANGSTLAITDVQFEVGTFCTTFERKLCDQVLAECQRYLPCSNSLNTFSVIGSGAADTTTAFICVVQFPVPTRVNVTNVVGASVTTPSQIGIHSNNGNIACTSLAIYNIGSSTASGLQLGVAAGLLAGAGGFAYFNSASGQVIFTGAQI